MLDTVVAGTILLADRAYDSDERREILAARGAWANIKPMSRRKTPQVFSQYLYRSRNLVERCFNKLKQEQHRFEHPIGRSYEYTSVHLARRKSGVRRELTLRNTSRARKPRQSTHQYADSRSPMPAQHCRIARLLKVSN